MAKARGTEFSVFEDLENVESGYEEEHEYIPRILEQEVEKEFDSALIDLNVLIDAILDRKRVGTLKADDKSYFPGLGGIFDDEKRKTYAYKIDPADSMKKIESLYDEGIVLYYPDSIENTIESAKFSSKAKSSELIDNRARKVLDGIEELAFDLPIKRSRRFYNEEDDLIYERARKHDIPTIITYDRDFTRYPDIEAFTPAAALESLQNQRGL